MQINQLFDAIAPIFTYFVIDLAYKQQAQQGFNWLKANKDVISEFFDDELSGNLIEELNKDDVDNIYYKEFWKAYNQLIEYIVSDYVYDWDHKWDEWGAKYITINGQKCLIGDSYDCYACYLDYESLTKEIERVIKESEERMCV